MSEQNLLYNYDNNTANHNSNNNHSNNLPFNFEFPISTTTAATTTITAPIIPKVAMTTNAYNHHYPYYLPPITTTANITFSSAIIHHQHQQQSLKEQQIVVLDQSTKQQWKNNKNDVSQTAIIINEKSLRQQQQKEQEEEEEPILLPTPPTHIVSPEAIREALKEEKEEALGHGQRRPFEQFSSFHALKQRKLSIDQSPPPAPPISPLPKITTSLSIPFSPPQSIKKFKYYQDGDDEEEEEEQVFDDMVEEEEEEEEEEPETPFPSISHNMNGKSTSNHNSNQAHEKLKRPPNAYLLFNRDMRRKLLKQSPKMTVAEISKEVGDWWKALPNDKREYYVREASVLKQEHLKKYPDFIYTRRSKAELAEAKKSSKLGRKSKSESTTMTHHHYENEEGQEEVVNTSTYALVFKHQSTLKQPDLILDTTEQQTNTKKRSRKSMSNNGQRDPRGRKKKRYKHPFAPKHPMSAYLYYLASVYPSVSLNFPGSTVGPISKSISKTWHAMTNEERLPWKQKAESDKARYAREMQIYTANNNLEQQPQQKVLEDVILLPPQEEDNREEKEEEEVDVQTLATVVSMVNNNGNSNNNLNSSHHYLYNNYQ